MASPATNRAATVKKIKLFAILTIMIVFVLAFSHPVFAGRGMHLNEDL